MYFTHLHIDEREEDIDWKEKVQSGDGRKAKSDRAREGARF